MITNKQNSRQVFNFGLNPTHMHLAKLRKYCEDAEKTISAWRLDEREHPTDEDSLIGILSFIHLSIRDTVNACADNHLTFSRVNHWLSVDNCSKFNDVKERNHFALLIQNLAENIKEIKTLYESGDNARAWEGATQTIFIAVQLHDLLKISKQESPEAKRIISSFFSDRASKNAKRPRKRSMSPIGGKALVELTRTESKKRTWNSAWEWLCYQAENHVNIDDFALESADDGHLAVRYWNQKKGCIKKTTFEKYWAKKKEYLTG